MSGFAVPYVDIGSFADNLIYLCETNSVGFLIAAVIQDWKDDNPDFLDLPLSTDDINALLKALTGCTLMTGTTLNCYPRGQVDQLLFDASGNPIG